MADVVAVTEALLAELSETKGEWTDRRLIAGARLTAEGPALLSELVAEVKRLRHELMLAESVAEMVSTDRDDALREAEALRRLTPENANGPPAGTEGPSL